MHSDTDSLLITNPTNIRYLTGFVGVEQRDAYLMLLPTKAFLLVSPLYQEEAKIVQFNNSFLKKQFPKIKTLDINILTPDNRITKQLTNICANEKIQTLSFESENITVSEYEGFKSVVPTLSPTQNVIEKLRVGKFPNEITSIKKAAKLTDDCFTFIQTKIQKGVTETDLSWEIETFFRKNGAENAFSPIVAFGKNSSQPHYMTPASARGPLAEKSIVLLDFGARVNGYCADMTRMIFVGKPKPEWIKAYNTVLLSQQTAIDNLSSSVSGAEIDRSCRKIIEDAGLPTYPHSLGHGVGLEIHEAPRLTIHNDVTLTKDMVITVEPATYIPNEFGIRIEDLVHIKDNEIAVLSTSTKEVIILL